MTPVSIALLVARDRRCRCRIGEAQRDCASVDLAFADVADADLGVEVADGGGGFRVVRRSSTRARVRPH